MIFLLSIEAARSNMITLSMTVHMCSQYAFITYIQLTSSYFPVSAMYIYIKLKL